MEVLRPGDIAKSMHSQIDQFVTVGQTIAHRYCTRAGQYDLAPVRGVRNARREIDRRPEVVAVPQLGHTGMDPDTGTQRLTHRPLLSSHRARTVDRRPYRTVCDREHRVYSVAPTFHDQPAMCLDRAAQDFV